MRRILPICLLVGLLLSILSPATAQPLELAALPGDFMGMVIRDPHYEWNTNPEFPNAVNRPFYDEMGKRLADAGVKWVRFEFRAEDEITYDPRNPSKGLRFSNYDYFINEVAPRHGFKIIGLLATNLVRNPGYIDPEEIERTDQEVKRGDDYPDIDCWKYKYGCGTNLYMRIWLDRAFAIADRYRDKVAAYEVMNEENRYIAGGGKGISPDRMAGLMAKFYRIFKVTGPSNTSGSFDPVEPWRKNVKLILGGIHPNRCDDCVTDVNEPLNDRQYLEAIYKSSAFTGYRNAGYSGGRFPLDGVGYHPYPMEMRFGLLPEESGEEELYRVPQRMAAMRKVMVDNGDAGNKIWVTEVGDRGAPADPENMQRQARFMSVIYAALWEQRDFVETVLWFKYEDFAVPSDPSKVGPENWGVVRLAACSPTPERPSCTYRKDGSTDEETYEYALEGDVQTFKASYHAFRSMAICGINGEACPRRTYLPFMTGSAARQ